MPRSSVTSCSSTIAPTSSFASLRIGEADSSIERSLPFTRDSSSARRLSVTGAPPVSTCRTGSDNSRRSVSSTRPTTSSSVLPITC